MLKQAGTLSWEYHFNEEAIAVEEYLSTADPSEFVKSRIRIALEQKILSWSKYTEWFKENFVCAVLDQMIGPADILKLSTDHRKISAKTKLGPDSLPLSEWEEKMIYLGFNSDETVFDSEKSIFVLTPPWIIDQVVDDNSDSEKIELSLQNYSEQHSELSLQARKKYDAFIVLKVSNNQTVLHKLDDDLENEGINEETFHFSLKEKNPFQDSYLNNKTVTFKLEDHNLSVLDFKHASVTPLKRGKTLLGFLMGLKITECENEDEQVLESLSKKAAS